MDFVSFFSALKTRLTAPTRGRALGVFLATLAFTGLLSSCAAAPAPPVAQSKNEDIPALLQHTWGFYKTRFMSNQERVKSNNYGGTISEGQSYAMLKAVWMNDPLVFDKVWQWTHQNMQRPTDRLIAWEWGQRDDGTWGIRSLESATDADQDIAYSLLLAGEKWQKPQYIADAQAMIQDLWRISVARYHGRYYLLSGTWEGFRQEYVTLNPSYFAPYVYRKFAEYDPAHATGWRQLAQDIYPTLEACSALMKNGLPPNWCAIPYDENKIIFSDRQGEGSRDFSYDAFRVYWRMGMDAALGSPEAKAYLQRHPFLWDEFARRGKLPEGFAPNGKPLEGDDPSGFSHSGALALSHALHPENTGAAYQRLLAPYYHREGYWFNDYNDFLHSVIWLHLYTLTAQDATQKK